MTHTPTVGITPATSHKINSSSVSSIQKCLRFKYFSTFFICVASLTLLTASLATQKWLVSKPIRIVRLLSQAQQAPLPPNNNLTTFTAHQSIPTDGVQSDQQQQHQYRTPWTVAGSQLDQTTTTARNSGLQHLNNPSLSSVDDSMVAISHSIGDSNELTSKFQGRVYFGLFTGLKVLNYGFGDRVSQLTVAHLFISNLDDAKPVSLPPTRHELINFKSWVITLSGVLLAMLFALIGSIFAIINFVIVPRGTVTGPVGLVTWNLAACASCTLSIFTWLVEYFIKLKWSVLSADEVQNGWTSENRSQFGYSYYFVVIAFMLHLVNVVIVSVVQSETWTSNSKKEAKRQASSVCDGVIMLY